MPNPCLPHTPAVSKTWPSNILKNKVFYRNFKPTDLFFKKTLSINSNFFFIFLMRPERHFESLRPLSEIVSLKMIITVITINLLLCSLFAVCYSHSTGNNPVYCIINKTCKPKCKVPFKSKRPNLSEFQIFGKQIWARS